MKFIENFLLRLLLAMHAFFFVERLQGNVGIAGTNPDSSAQYQYNGVRLIQNDLADNKIILSLADTKDNSIEY